MQTEEGLWRLSPSGLYTFTECKSCFWLDNHHGRGPHFPLVLNTAMDTILKHRYDAYRANRTFPTEAQELLKEGIRPYTDLAQLDKWRGDYKALTVTDEEVGYILRGKIDDVLVERDDCLIPADYKASGGPPSDDKQKYYRDQLAAYGFMFKHHGHPVSDRAYLFHYYPVDKTDPGVSVTFAGKVDKVDIGAVEIEQKFKDIVALLNGSYPGDNPECEQCSFVLARVAAKS